MASEKCHELQYGPPDPQTLNPKQLESAELAAVWNTRMGGLTVPVFPSGRRTGIDLIGALEGAFKRKCKPPGFTRLGFGPTSEEPQIVETIL